MKIIKLARANSGLTLQQLQVAADHACMHNPQSSLFELWDAPMDDCHETEKISPKILNSKFKQFSLRRWLFLIPAAIFNTRQPSFEKYTHYYSLRLMLLVRFLFEM